MCTGLEKSFYHIPGNYAQWRHKNFHWVLWEDNFCKMISWRMITGRMISDTTPLRTPTILSTYSVIYTGYSCYSRLETRWAVSETQWALSASETVSTVCGLKKMSTVWCCIHMLSVPDMGQRGISVLWPRYRQEGMPFCGMLWSCYPTQREFSLERWLGWMKNDLAPILMLWYIWKWGYYLGMDSVKGNGHTMYDQC